VVGQNIRTVPTQTHIGILLETGHMFFLLLSGSFQIRTLKETRMCLNQQKFWYAVTKKNF